MKIMKNKFITFVLILTVVMTQLIVPMQASASAAEPTPVFTMDLSAYNAENQTVKNGVTGSADGIFVRNASTTAKPNVKTYYDTNGQKVLALQTADDETKDTYRGAVEIDKATIDALLGTKGDKEMTVTFWDKSYGRNNTSMFNYAVGNGEKNTTALINTWNTTSATEFKVQVSGSYNAKNLQNDVWRFNAISIKWTDSETTEGKGTWTCIGFAGGTAFNFTTSEVSFIDNSGMDMTIGGRINETPEIKTQHNGEFAGFAVYNEALTLDQLTAIKTSQGYDQLLAPAELTFGKDESNMQPTDENFTFTTNGTAGDKTDFEVMNENGVEFVRITHSGTGETRLGYDFGTVQTASFVLDAKIRRSDNTFDRTLRINGNDDFEVHKMNTTTNFGHENKDEDGFVNMRYIFDYLGENEWRITKYDRVKDAIFNKHSLATYTVTGGLKSVEFKVWANGSDKYPHGEDYYMDIAEFKVCRKPRAALFADVTDDAGTKVYSINADGNYEVTLTAHEVTGDTYAYFAIYEEDSLGNIRLYDIVGGKLDETMSVTDTFTLEAAEGCTYTAKGLMWGAGEMPLVKTVNYK